MTSTLTSNPGTWVQASYFQPNVGPGGYGFRLVMTHASADCPKIGRRAKVTSKLSTTAHFCDHCFGLKNVAFRSGGYVFLGAFVAGYDGRFDGITYSVQVQTKEIGYVTESFGSFEEAREAANGFFRLARSHGEEVLSIG